jgi:hypothetical protein
VCLKSLQPLSREFGIFRMNENDRIQIKLHFFFFIIKMSIENQQYR